MRKENIIYYGSMEDRYIIMMQILETKKEGDLDVATKIAIQLQQTSPTVRMKDRIVKKSEKNSLWSAMDIASIWLESCVIGEINRNPRLKSSIRWFGVQEESFIMNTAKHLKAVLATMLSAVLVIRQRICTLCWREYRFYNTELP